jgi:hypothetical protein
VNDRPTPAPAVNGLWRILLHAPDADDHDPKWLLTTVALPTDVMPAGPGDEWPQVDGWLRQQLGRPCVLHRVINARAWLVEEV